MNYRRSNWQIVVSGILIVAVWFGALPAFAQTKPDGKGVGVKIVTELPSKEKRWALIIGVDTYQKDISPLYGTVNDAKALRDVLIKYAGFTEERIILMTTDSTDADLVPTRGNIIDQLDKLQRVVPEDGLILFSFSGHGVSIGNDAFIVPADGRIYQNADLMRERAIDVLRIKRAIQDTKVKQVIMFLDACRNDPVKGKGDADNNLTTAYTKGFSFETKNQNIEAYATLYATSFGDRAYEFLDKKTNKYRGYFSYAIEEGLKGSAANDKGEVTLAGLIRYIEDTVKERVRINENQKQIPYPTTEGFRSSNLVIAVAVKKPPITTNPNSGETTFWNAIENSNEIEVFENYLKRVESGEFKGVYKSTAELKIAKLKEANQNTVSVVLKQPPILDIVTAQSILDRAIQTRDGSIQGQVQAIESLLARGHEFSNTDLSGISLRGANISQGIFKKIKMHAVDLSGANAQNADFSESGLRFANLENGRFGYANFSETYAPFISAKNAKFENADFSDANLFSGDLREADFSNAKLRGASFAFADLRGVKFDGADLTGAYFVGAILDNATFGNAVIENTEFTGAVAEKFDLTLQQKSGACRHYRVLSDSWSMTLIDWTRGESQRTIEHKSVYFDNFTDRTLPLCTTKPLDPYYNVAKDGLQYTILLNSAYVSKADRRNLFARRLQEHVELLSENLTKSRILKGDNSQLKKSDAMMREAVKKASPVSKSFLNSDLIILHLLKNGLIDEKKIDWNYLAELHYNFENQIRNDKKDFADYSMWSPVFPPNVFWEDLPQDKDILFKNWTLARVSKAPQQVILKKAFTIIEDEKSKITLDKIKLGQMGAQYTDVSSTELSKEQMISLTPYIDRIGLYKVFYVFPEKIKHYKIELPDKFKILAGLEIEMDLKIEKINRLSEKDSYDKEISSALVFVTPDNVRLLQNGKLVWSGSVQKDSSELE